MELPGGSRHGKGNGDRNMGETNLGMCWDMITHFPFNLGYMSIYIYTYIYIYEYYKITSQVLYRTTSIPKSNGAFPTSHQSICALFRQCRELEPNLQPASLGTANLQG
jgi:hypothetical protein